MEKVFAKNFIKDIADIGSAPPITMHINAPVAGQQVPHKDEVALLGLGEFVGGGIGTTDGRMNADGVLDEEGVFLSFGIVERRPNSTTRAFS